jgi:hypothetical protein
LGRFHRLLRSIAIDGIAIVVDFSATYVEIATAASAARRTPVAMVECSRRSVVPLARGVESSDKLGQIGLAAGTGVFKQPAEVVASQVRCRASLKE